MDRTNSFCENCHIRLQMKDPIAPILSDIPLNLCDICRAREAQYKSPGLLGDATTKTNKENPMNNDVDIQADSLLAFILEPTRICRNHDCKSLLCQLHRNIIKLENQIQRLRNSQKKNH